MASILVLVSFGFTPARLFAAPPATRLPPGVHAVVAVPAEAVAGSGRRGAMLGVAAAHAGAGAGYTVVAVPAEAVAGSGRRGAMLGVAAAHAGAGAGYTAVAVPAEAVAGSGRRGAMLGVAAAHAGAGAGAGYTVVAVPASSVGEGLGRRGAMRGVPVHAAPEAGATADGGAGDKTKDTFYTDLEYEALRTLGLMAFMDAPAALAGKAEGVKAELEAAMESAKAGLADKTECVLGLLRAVYGVMDLAEECRALEDARVEYVPSRFCPATEPDGKATLVVGERTALTFDFDADDTDAMLKAVGYAVEHAVNATARRVGPDRVHDILPFTDPEAEEW